MNAAYKSKTSTRNASVNKRDDCGIWASATSPISAMRLSVRFRTSNFSFSILACVTERGLGLGFVTISGFKQVGGKQGNVLPARVEEGTVYIHATLSVSNNNFLMFVFDFKKST